MFLFQSVLSFVKIVSYAVLITGLPQLCLLAFQLKADETEIRWEDAEKESQCKISGNLQGTNWSDRIE